MNKKDINDLRTPQDRKQALKTYTPNKEDSCVLSGIDSSGQSVLVYLCHDHMKIVTYQRNGFIMEKHYDENGQITEELYV